jgi:hypothetical protein
MTFDPAFVSNLLLVLTGFGGAFLAALWISLVIWTYRDIRTRARDPLVHTLATLLVAILNPACWSILSFARRAPLKRNTSAHSKRKLCCKHWRTCLFARVVSAASKMTGRSARIVTRSSRRPVRTATGSWNCPGISVHTAGHPRPECAATRPAWTMPCAA